MIMTTKGKVYSFYSIVIVLLIDAFQLEHLCQGGYMLLHHCVSSGDA